MEALGSPPPAMSSGLASSRIKSSRLTRPSSRGLNGPGSPLPAAGVSSLAASGKKASFTGSSRGMGPGMLSARSGVARKDRRWADVILEAEHEEVHRKKLEIPPGALLEHPCRPCLEGRKGRCVVWCAHQSKRQCHAWGIALLGLVGLALLCCGLFIPDWINGDDNFDGERYQQIREGLVWQCETVRGSDLNGRSIDDRSCVPLEQLELDVPIATLTSRWCGVAAASMSGLFIAIMVAYAVKMDVILTWVAMFVAALSVLCAGVTVFVYCGSHHRKQRFIVDEFKYGSGMPLELLGAAVMTALIPISYYAGQRAFEAVLPTRRW